MQATEQLAIEFQNHLHDTWLRASDHFARGPLRSWRLRHESIITVRRSTSLLWFAYNSHCVAP